MVLDLGGSPPGAPVPGDATAGRQAPPHRPSRTALLYERVVALVEQLIADQGLVPGDLLPSYTELADRAGVSLITVRRALDELERAGRVRRHQGLGTFVARPRILAEPARTGSLLATLADDEGAAAQLRTSVLGLDQGEPSVDLARALRIERGRPAWRLRRLRLLDGRPAVLETSVIPVALAPELDALLSRLGGSLYDLLAAEYGLVDSYEEQYLEVIGPAQEEGRLLELPPRAQVVRIRGVSADEDGVPFDCFEQLYPASQFAFAFSGSATRQLLPAPGSRDWTVRPVP
ncbi:MAG: GntR family transcriptional regulator [Streptosporangiaceae bacterium]